jgi:hypothetical protein
MIAMTAAVQGSAEGHATAATPAGSAVRAAAGAHAQPDATPTQEAVSRFVPFVSRDHVLVPPTITPTPNPTPTAYPEPAGFDVRCSRSGAIEICSWLVAGEPTAGGYVEAAVRLLERDHPVVGVRMNVRWVFPYPTLFRYCDAPTGPDGVAVCGSDVPHASGFSGAAQIGLPYGGWPYQRQIGFRIH